MKTKLSARNIAPLQPSNKAYEVVDTDLKGFLLRVQPTGRKTFYYSYRNGVDRKRIKIGVLGSELTLQQARDKAIKFAALVVEGEDIQATKQKARSTLRNNKEKTLDKFIENHYLPWALENLKSGQSSVELVRSNFRDLLDAPINYVTVAHIEKWRTFKLKKGIKPSTVNRCVSALRAVLTKAELWEVIPDHPLRKLKALHTDNAPKVRYLASDEEERLFQTLSLRDQELKDARERGNEHRRVRGYSLLPTIINFAYADRMTPLITLSLKTGMRRGELFDLTWDNVDFEREVITVVAETAKSNRTRHIPLSPIALKTLQQWREQSPLETLRVFPSDEGDRLNNVAKSWASILKRSYIHSFRWHDMRHDFASKLVVNGVPLNTVRELCGHSDLNTTLRYAHLAPDHKSDAVALLG